MIVLFYSLSDDPVPWQAALAQALPELELRVWPDLGRIEDIQYALVWKPPAGLLASLPNLKAILSLGAGVDHLFLDPLLPRHLPMTRMVDAGLAVQMSEYALYGVLHFHRSMDRYAELQRRGEWRQLPAVAPSDRSVGVMGLGVLGQDFVRKALTMGFQVLGWSRSPHRIEHVRTFHGGAQLDAFFAATQILVNFLPLTPETERLLDARAFARLPRGAFLVNIARGAHVVEADLLAALDSGQLGGALLDVFAREPLPPDDPLWRHPRVIVTPHVAGQAIPKLMLDQVVDTLRRFERGERPLGLVDVARGY